MFVDIYGQYVYQLLMWFDVQCELFDMYVGFVVDVVNVVCVWCVWCDVMQVIDVVKVYECELQFECEKFVWQFVEFDKFVL